MPQQRNPSPKAKLGIALGVADKTQRQRFTICLSTEWVAEKRNRNFAATHKAMQGLDVASLRIFFGGGLVGTWRCDVFCSRMSRRSIDPVSDFW